MKTKFVSTVVNVVERVKLENGDVEVRTPHALRCNAYCAHLLE